jgi:hypothetical protein
MPDRTAPTRTQSATAPSTSARLRRAAAAELPRLVRKRDQLAHRSELLRSERERIEIMLIGLEERIALLDRLTSQPAQPARSTTNGLTRAARPEMQIQPRPGLRTTATGVPARSAAAPGQVRYHRLVALISSARTQLRTNGSRDSESD